MFTGNNQQNTAVKKPFKKFVKFPKKVLGPGELYKPFAISFNSDIPQAIQDKLITVIERFNQSDLTARVDGTTFGDPFEAAIKKFEVYLPWQNFNNKTSKDYFNTDQSKDVAKKFVPAFDTLKSPRQAFICRNVRMILGRDLKSPCIFVIVWSEDGAERPKDKTARTGIISNVLDLAYSMRIPVFNLQREDAFQRMEYFFEKPFIPSTSTFQF